MKAPTSACRSRPNSTFTSSGAWGIREAA
jgi:hypothetical protein